MGSKKKLSAAFWVSIVETTRAILRRPEVKASLKATKSEVLKGQREEYRYIEEVDEHAKKIVLILQKLNVKINRIGISGIPGTGKSTLGRALAKILDMQWKSLDHETMSVQRDFSKEQTIYEHHRLFQTQNLEIFDLVIYIDESVLKAKDNVMSRTQSGRGAIIIDVLNFEKLKKISKLAFESCEGGEIYIENSNIIMKIRGPQGFKNISNIKNKLFPSIYDRESMNKEEMLFLLAYNRPKSGLKAYLRLSAFNNEIAQGILSGVRKFLNG